MPQLLTLRQGVVDFLNLQAFGVTAVGAYEATAELEQFAEGQARLLVIPRALELEFLTFDGKEDGRKATVDVVLQYHARAITAAELDPYVTLSERIAESCLAQSIPIAPLATNCAVMETHFPEGTWNEEHLRKYAVLTIVIQLVLQQVD